MTTTTMSVEEENLSVAWAKAFLAAMAKGTRGLAPLTVTVTGLQDGVPVESPEIRKLLDATLLAETEYRSHTVANTIFPENLRRRSADRQVFFEKYGRVVKKIKRRPNNRSGVYFERMIQFGSGPEGGNQLEHLIKTWLSGNHRPSALQVVIFDPARDHTNQRRRGFPCMQHVSFSNLGHGRLSVNATYATQYLFTRAYGNYLGLCRLGRFVAQELKMELVQMSCFAGLAMLGAENKARLGVMTNGLREMIREAESPDKTTRVEGDYANAR